MLSTTKMTKLIEAQTLQNNHVCLVYSDFSNIFSDVCVVFCPVLPGLLSISSKFLPTIMNLLRRLAEEAQGHTAASGGTESQHRTDTSQAFRSQVPKPNLVTSSSIPSSSVSSVASSDGDSEYSSTNLTHRRRTNIQEEAELS
ncbi:protein ROOT HAIR DEFECTIVE 3-like protein 2-like isoform X1 [Senna tora]|uniref:Protein ROOT HAIR DEFECTIVE 3-like protein 2-like isoform X1 n=1 Tax=Senna tora TaxID=362788 RepID=A0A834XDN2_9FABA|nr:protein ROOT HAIR DEFECTIVE 3-like protein 2-like isoform X1 [Senna tora]